MDLIAKEAKSLFDSLLKAGFDLPHAMGLTGIFIEKTYWQMRLLSNEKLKQINMND